MGRGIVTACVWYASGGSYQLLLRPSCTTQAKYTYYRSISLFLDPSSCFFMLLQYSLQGGANLVSQDILVRGVV